MLEMPPTIRFPKPEEIPAIPEIIARMKDIEHANLVEGYLLNYNHSLELPFTFFAEININNSRIWDVFLQLTKQLPNQVSLVWSLNGSESNHSKYIEKQNILKYISPFKTELTQDTKIGFGLIFQTNDKLEEVYMSVTKTLKVWSSNEIAFRQLLNQLGIDEIRNLDFIEEFPYVTQPLHWFHEKTLKIEMVVSQLKKQINKNHRFWNFW